MKKLIYIFSLIVVIILLKYYLSDYEVKYKVNNYNVVEKVSDNYTYIDIYVDSVKYSFKYDLKRSINKKRVKKLDISDGCVRPIMSGYDTYFICYKDGEFTTKNIEIDDSKFDEDIKYNKYLDSSEYIYIWKYDGFYKFHSDMESVNMFLSDKYSNDLMISYDKYLLMPRYDKEYTFSDFYLLDMKSSKYKTIKSKYSIHYDSYYSGIYKNKVYLFDNKSNELYEINIDKLSVKLVGNEFKGYIKYVNNKRKSAKVSEYTKDKITYFKTKDEFMYVDKNKFSYDKVSYVKYFNSEDIDIVSVYKDVIYFIYEDNLYRYKDSDVSLIIHYFEYNFNKNNITFVYND